MKHKENLVTLIIFLIMIFGGGMAFILIPDSKFSENENRYLQTAPKFSQDKIRSGEFMEEFDKYVSDQFPMRNSLMATASEYKYIMGMRDINGVYLAGDGYLMTRTEKSETDPDRIRKNTEYINDFFEKYSDTIGSENICFMLVPEAATVLDSKLPGFASSQWEKNIISEIRCNIRNATVAEPEKNMNPEECQMYYKTDHHWTVFGAFEAYREYAGIYGKNPDKASYDFVKVTDSFRGSLYSKVLLPDSSYDEIFLYDKVKNVKINADNEILPLYDYDALNRKDKYEVFMGGNYGLVEIDGNGEGSILIIKDSFANSFVPFLIDDYDEIIMVDLRYYMGNVDRLVETENITRILVLYQITNFITDENMIKLGL